MTQAALRVVVALAVVNAFVVADIVLELFSTPLTAMLDDWMDAVLPGFSLEVELSVKMCTLVTIYCVPGLVAQAWASRMWPSGGRAEAGPQAKA